jgi:hypothetical protein
MLPGYALELQAGHIHVNNVGVIYPGEFIGTDQLPTESTAQKKQDDGNRKRPDCPDEGRLRWGTGV